MNNIILCGVRIDNVTREEAVTAVLQGTVRPAVVFTPNAVMLEAARCQPDIAAMLSRATLSLPDGAGVLLAAKRIGAPLCERVAGISFGDALLERAAERGLRVFLLGGRPGVAARAGQRLTERFSNLRIVGTQDGYFEKTGEENDRVLERIRKSGAEILFVCFGFPMQERWILQNQAAISEMLAVAALGGSLDVWAGDSKRAPAWMGTCGLEWLWRTVREPKRLSRIPHLLRFAVHSRHTLLRDPAEKHGAKRKIHSQNAHRNAR